MLAPEPICNAINCSYLVFDGHLPNQFVASFFSKVDLENEFELYFRLSTRVTFTKKECKIIFIHSDFFVTKDVYLQAVFDKYGL